MKTIYRIAKTELFTLFYSPVAWLVLVVFAFQVNMEFSGLITNQLRSKSLDYDLWEVTSSVFTLNMSGLFPRILGYLYLYLPLLTMGLMSREIKSGSIKLLYSSPITNSKIVLGKYLAMMTYCFLLVLILFFPVLFSAATVKDFDMPLVLSGLLGIYLLICAYAAIGLFMSCLTSYQVVAAMGTLAMLAILNFVGEVGQGIAFVRDITYWLSISGRANEFINGLICSEDFLYFLIVISLFVIFSIIKLELEVKNKTIRYGASIYLGVLLIAMLLGYISSRPSLMSYYDTTQTKENTLTVKSQEIMEKLDGDLKIVTYVNILDKDYYNGIPTAINNDFERFKKYVRFKPEIEMEYVYYYDKSDNENLYSRYPGLTEEEIARKVADINDLDFGMFLSPDEIRKIVDLRPERNRFVRQIVRGDGQKEWLRLFEDNQKFPSETEISAVLQRFIVKAPKVGFLTGHGERVINRNRDIDYSAFVVNKWFRNSMLNQGFDGVNLSLKGDKEIPEDMSIIVIPDIKSPLSDEEMEKLDRYIAKGGNLIITGEPGRHDILNPLIEQFGVQLMAGSLVQKIPDLTPNIAIGNYTDNANEVSYRLQQLKDWGYQVVFPGASGLRYETNRGYNVKPLLMTNDKQSWNELETTDFLEEPTLLNPAIGEKEESLPIALTLSRQVGDKEQRIMIFGDTDFISNGELSRSRSNAKSANMGFIPGIFQWMSYDQYPIDTRRPFGKDTDMNIGFEWALWIKIFFMGVIPFLLALSGSVIWVVRKRY